MPYSSTELVEVWFNCLCCSPLFLCASVVICSLCLLCAYVVTELVEVWFKTASDLPLRNHRKMRINDLNRILQFFLTRTFYKVIIRV
jgi:hypothetical protein